MKEYRHTSFRKITVEHRVEIDLSAILKTVGAPRTAKIHIKEPASQGKPTQLSMVSDASQITVVWTEEQDE